MHSRRTMRTPWRQTALSSMLLALLAGCSKPSPPPKALDAASPIDAAADASRPTDGCPRFGETDTPWSAGGLIASLSSDAILEPATREARANRVSSDWTLVGRPITLDVADARLAVVSLADNMRDAIVSLRQVESGGYCVVGVRTELFGGAGIRAELVAHEKSLDGYSEFLAFDVTQGMNQGGQILWACKLEVLQANRHGLSPAEQTAAGACPDKPPPIRFVRTNGKLRLKRGNQSWTLDPIE